jgi:signal transduction histidine kinase
MRLGEFITRDMENILVAWESFAGTCGPAGKRMESLELRDHAPQILEAIVADLATPQSRDQQAAKSRGLGPAAFPAGETAAQAHAVLRAKAGFDFQQLAAEYRALRASVLSLWMDSVDPAERPLEDVVRFNEAIDQALAESISHFSAQVEQSRNLLLGMLSHDMRSPLQTIQMTALHLGKLNAGQVVSDAARKLINSGTRLNALLDDMVDFNRSNLGIGISMTPRPADLGALCTEEVEQIRAARPGCPVELDVPADCRGCWDGKRIQQLVGNLVINALTHGAQGSPVRVAVRDHGSEVSIEVANAGPALPGRELEHIFEPLQRGAHARNDAGLGLGLYIVTQIAKAHGGVTEACSNDTETVFRVTLPRTAPGPDHASRSMNPEHGARVPTECV